MGNQDHPQDEFVELTTLEEANSVDKPSAKRGFVEVLVDPKTLHGLMLCGGGLLVLGLAVWLWSVGVFENRLVMASCLGVGNFAILASGIFGVLKTRYQTASKAVTLLACLLMPLNLWFYDAQGLITLDQGGHLWIPAMLCCAIYIAVARILKEPRFAYTIVGGITLTGMLFLADQQIGHFWEITAPSTFLIVFGGICIHFERVFPIGVGPFSRNSFGREFFRAGHVVLGTGLALLLAGHISGWLFEPLFAGLNWFAVPAVTTQTILQCYSLAMALWGSYCYAYSYIAVRNRKHYLVATFGSLVFSTIILLDLMAVPFTMEIVALLVAIAALAANLVNSLTTPEENIWEEEPSHSKWSQPLVNMAGSLAVGLNLLTVCLTGILYTRDRFDLFYELMPYELNWVFLTATLLGGSASLLGLRTVFRSSGLLERSWHLQSLALLAMFALAGISACLGISLTIVTLSIELLLPLSVGAISLLARTNNVRQGGSRLVEIATTLLLIVGSATVFGLVSLVPVTNANLWLTLFFATTAACYGLASVHATQLTSAVLSAGCACVASWTLLIYLGVTQHGFFLATSLVGTSFLIASNISKRLRNKTSTFARVSLWTGRVLISCGGVALILMSAARLVTGEVQATMLFILATQIGAALVAAILSGKSIWRHHFLVLAASEIAVVILVVNALSAFSFWQRGELFVTAIGLAMLLAGYFGWYRETDQKNELTSMNLALGSILSAAPFTIGLLFLRFANHGASWGWVLTHELGVLVVGLVLLGAGVLCRIRWSTLVGATALSLYIISLVGLVQLPDRLQSTAVYMMVGGSLFFGTAVLLSIYRDRLLALPQRAQEGRGVFRIFKWR